MRVSAVVTPRIRRGTWRWIRIQELTPRRCQWCSAVAAEADTHCKACGANLAQRDALGELVIPGVTHVDPELKAYDKDPLRIPRASPSQYVAGPAMGAAIMAGGPAALVGLAALGAVAGAEYAAAGRGRLTQADLDKLGQPSEATLQMLQKLEEEERGQRQCGRFGPAVRRGRLGAASPASPAHATSGFAEPASPDKPTIL